MKMGTRGEEVKITEHFEDDINGRPLYRDRLKGLYVVARSLFLLLLTCSAWLWLGPA